MTIIAPFEILKFFRSCPQIVSHFGENIWLSLAAPDTNYKPSDGAGLLATIAGGLVMPSEDCFDNFSRVQVQIFSSTEAGAWAGWKLFNDAVKERVGQGNLLSVSNVLSFVPSTNAELLYNPDTMPAWCTVICYYNVFLAR